MKNRYLCVAMAGILAIGMISCGNPAAPENFCLTQDNVDEYVVSLGQYDGLSVSEEKQEVTDELIEYYANHYYEGLAKKTPGMTDNKGNIIPMTDDAIEKLDSEVYTSVTEFMNFVRDVVTDYSVYEYENRIFDDVLENVVNDSVFNEIPEGLLKNQEASISDKYLEAAKEHELKLDQYLIICGTSLEELSDLYAKKELVLFKIAKDIGIEETGKEAVKAQVFDYILASTNVN